MALCPHFLRETMVSTYDSRRPQATFTDNVPLDPVKAILPDENQVLNVHNKKNLL